MASKHAVIPDRELNPYCAIFPEPSEAEYRELVESIRESGQRIPIQLDAEGRILDGRTRYKACQELYLKPKLVKWEGRGSAALYAAFVLAANVKRRHLTAGQRAAAAAAVANLTHGGDRKSPAVKPENRTGATENAETGENQGANLRLDPPMTIDHAAKAAGVSPRSVDSAKRIQEKNPELLEQVKRGEKSLHAAEQELDADDGPAAMLDEVGNPLTPGVLDAFIECDEFAKLKTRIDAIRREIEAMAERSDPLLTYVQVQVLTTDLKNAANAIRLALPYCLCPTCSGDDFPKCKHCKQQGWMPKAYYEQTTRPEQRWGDAK